jgi:hypothetical protein
MSFIWKKHYDKYMMLQRNHKKFTPELLEKLVRQQQKEITIINSFLKTPPATILDIGCGLGIYDLAIHDFFKGEILFYLLDKTTTTEEEKSVYYGHYETAAFYNNLNYTKEFLMLNGIAEQNINCINIDNDINTANDYLQKNLSNIDLVISIISWGFHYPIKTYLDTVYNILSNNGLLCLHCRHLDENLTVLLTKFEILAPQHDNIKEGSFLICKKR